MAMFISAIATRNGDIIMEPEYTNMHEDLVDAYMLRDAGILGAGGRAWTRFEFVPPHRSVQDMGDVSLWRLNQYNMVDWWPDVEESVLEKMRARVDRMIVRKSTRTLLGGAHIILNGHVDMIRGKVFAVSPEADLSNTSMVGVNMRCAYVKYAHFEGADLSGAMLNGAFADHAHFENANLRGANLSCASTQGTYFTNADMRRSLLTGTDIDGSQTRGARLEGACYIDERLH